MTDEITEIAGTVISEEETRQERPEEAALPEHTGREEPAQPETPCRGKAGLVIGVCAGVLALLAGVFAILYWVIQIPLFDRSGWAKTEAGAVCYLDYYGKPLKGWQTISDGRYYFSAVDGAAQTGWLELPEGRYYLNDAGRAWSGWLKEEDGMRYLDGDGAMHTGWLALPEGRYYFTQDGTMATGWTETPDGWALFEEDGLLVPQWGRDADGYFYLEEDGSYHTGWLEYNGKTYRFGEDGRTQTGWLDLEDGKYYLDEEGVLQTGWLELPEGRYHLGGDGKMRTGWARIDGKQYYFDETGAQKTGWITTDNSRYYLLEEGDLATGFVEIDGVKRYFTRNGEYIVLVNPWNPVPEDYEMKLVDFDGFQVDATCVDALEEMMEACRRAGYGCKINYAYRDEELQQYMWDVRYNRYRQAGYSHEGALARVKKEVAVPGTSEHHLGLAVDIGASEGGYRWLEENSWQYGFIMRYPDNKTEVTGIVYEVWHYRYVGEDAAEAMYLSGLCMEEYLDALEKDMQEENSEDTSAEDPADAELTQ